jgi:hypothetical protein
MNLSMELLENVLFSNVLNRDPLGGLHIEYLNPIQKK